MTTQRRLPRRAEGRPARPGPGSDAGFTLIEVLVAITVFAIISGALGTVLMRSTKMSFTNRGRVVAANLASQQLEFLRNIADPMSAPTQKTVNTGGVNYTIDSQLKWEQQSTTSDTCAGSGATSQPAYISALVTVRWPNMGDTKPVTVNTLILPPEAKPSAGSSVGAVAVKVTNRAGAGAPNHVVTLVSADATQRTQTTDAYGCATFINLAPGSYNVSLGTAGYVDLADNPAPSQGMTVTAGAAKPQKWKIVYDRPVS